MSENKIGQHLENLTEDAKKYIEAEIEYYKLDVYKKLIKASSGLIWLLIVSSLALLLFTFLCVGLSLFVGELLGSYYLGFFTISGVFLILLIVVILFSKPIIEEKTILFFNKLFKD